MAAKQLSRECFKKKSCLHSHVAKKHRKVSTSSGNVKGVWGHEDQSQGVRDGNQAAVGGGMNGSGVGNSRSRVSVDGMGRWETGNSPA